MGRASEAFIVGKGHPSSASAPCARHKHNSASFIGFSHHCALLPNLHAILQDPSPVTRCWPSQPAARWQGCGAGGLSSTNASNRYISKERHGKPSAGLAIACMPFAASSSTVSRQMAQEATGSRFVNHHNVKQSRRRRMRSSSPFEGAAGATHSNLTAARGPRWQRSVGRCQSRLEGRARAQAVRPLLLLLQP